MGKEEGKTRKTNIEILRILAMLMIITLHYLDKGGILNPFSLRQGMNQNIAWFLEMLSFVSVNVYVLISGYFLTESKFRVKKILLLWAEVIFYSYVIGAVFYLLHLMPAEQMNFYDLRFIPAPVTTGHYWFATVYLMMYAIFPFLNVGIAHMTQKQHKAALVVFTILFSVWNSVLPFTIPLTDQKGMDLLWFVLLYLFASYIRRYPECFRRKQGFYLLGYFGMIALTYGSAFALLLVDQIFGKLGGYALNLCNYNSLTILIASVCLFLFFIKWDLKPPVWIGKAMIGLASCTFGVLLIHEHRFMRYFWPKLFHVEEYKDSPLLILHWIGTVIAVFVICALIDKIRQLLFGLITNRKFFDKWMAVFQPFEDRMNGGVK